MKLFGPVLSALAAVLRVPCLGQEVLWDFGPQTGPVGGCWQDVVGGQNFAEHVVLGQGARVAGYQHFSCVDGLQGKTFEIKFLADDGGTPGGEIARFHAVPNAHTVEGGQHRYDFGFKTVVLDPGSYWIGLAGVGFDAAQVSIKPGPGDSTMAQFNDQSFVELTTVGDQMFRLLGGGEQGCYSDFDGDGELTLFDFLAYVNAFNGADAQADCDNNGGLDFFDFLCFTNAFNDGC